MICNKSLIYNIILLCNFRETPNDELSKVVNERCA
jgi:hypothetical protein